MDALHVAILTLALALGAVQHVLDRDRLPVAVQAAPRWWTNAGLFAATTACVSLLAAAITWAAARGTPPVPAVAIGGLPLATQVPLFLLAQSLVQYGLHRAAHAVPLLWRLHRVHHTDRDLDATTGLRHHPFEGMLDHLALLGPTLVLAPTPEVVLVSLLVGIGFALFAHLDPGWVPARLDRALRLAIVTPRMHRLHHSTWQPETDTNFGTVLTFWDRLFGTYLEPPDTPRAGFALGLDEVPRARAQDLGAMLAQPFMAADRGNGQRD